MGKTPKQRAEIKAEKNRRLLEFFKNNPMTFKIEPIKSVEIFNSKFLNKKGA